MLIELEPAELRQLLDLGERALGELRVEVRRTSTPGYRDSLMAERDLLREVVEKLRAHAGKTVG